MSILKLSPHVTSVGADHPERPLFDNLMPLEHGTTYNSYLVQGSEKTLLIDPVDETKFHILLNNLQEAGVETIDYIANLHTEQDHAGTTEALTRLYPEAQLVASPKVIELMGTHLHIPADRFMVLNAGEQLDLGDLHLTCHPIAWAHWPDNTMLYLEEEGILFSSDLFGSHYAQVESSFVYNSADVRKANRAYYAEIMMPYRAQVAKHTAKVREMNPRMIAPAHGPVWENPDAVLDLYTDWTSDAVLPKVVIGYVTMHGSTRAIVQQLTHRIAAAGIEVSCHNLVTHPEDLMIESGEFMNAAVDASTAIIATPTVITGPHPAAAYLAILMNALKPKLKHIGFVTSYGWAGKTVDTLDALTSNLKAERFESLQIKGLPNEEDQQAIDKWADEVIKAVKADAE